MPEKTTDQRIEALEQRLDALEATLAKRNTPASPAPLPPINRRTGTAKNAHFATSPERAAELEKKYGNKPTPAEAKSK